MDNEASRSLHGSFGWRRDDRFDFYTLPVGGDRAGPPD